MSEARSWLICASMALVVLGSAAGCSNDEPTNQAPKVRTLGAQRVPVAAPAQPVSPSPETTDQTEPPKPPPHVAITGSDGAPLTYTVAVRREAAAPRVDPDLAVIASGRTAAAACFTDIRDNSPTRSAIIRVTVLPSGTVNRSEVSSSSTTEPWILSCLESVGDGLHFSDKPKADIRTYSIDVTVTRTH